MTISRKDLALYFVAGTQDLKTTEQDRAVVLCELLERALKSGVSCFQLREKGQDSLSDPVEVESLAKRCLTICKCYNVPFIINDDVELALAIGANGIHVGQKDTPITEVIATCADKLSIGLSINTFEQAVTANQLEGVDYFGVGPIFPTTSKADAEPVVGITLVKQIRNAGFDKPLVGIGGINFDNASQVTNAGADGIAMISAITSKLT